MTVKKAFEIISNYERIKTPTEDEDFNYIEACKFIIEKKSDPYVMLSLGGWYYEKKHFELALKYYEMAAVYKLEESYNCLGYIWYYGRTGTVDYEKAFKYFSLAADAGIEEAIYKVADMYKNGYFVEKNYEKYTEIIEKLWDDIKNNRKLYSSVPSVAIRLGKIRKDQERFEEAAELFIYAKDFLAQKLKYNAFFGNITNMKWAVEELYKVVEFDVFSFDLYDLFYLLKGPEIYKVNFILGGEIQTVENFAEEDGTISVKYNDTWFRSPVDFFLKATYRGERLTALYRQADLFEIAGRKESL